MRLRHSVIALAVILLLFAFYSIAASMPVVQNAVSVTRAGSPAPDGSLAHPYQMVEAGILGAWHRSVHDVTIESGDYAESFTIDKPSRLSATGGSVTIGKLDHQASTTLEILTLNTHLFGTAAPWPASCVENWIDGGRATDIGSQLSSLRDAGLDFVALQEVWDVALFQGQSIICGWIANPTVWPASGFTYGDGGWDTDCLICIPSGLAVLSSHPLSGFKQIFWTECDGTLGDCLASKGWVEATFFKDGFGVHVINLHTQAGEDEDEVEARSLQIAQLRDAIVAYRLSHPTHVLFVMGDFNIYGEGAEYNTTLIPEIGATAGGRDADRNSPGFVVGTSSQWTYCDCNPLATYFDEDAVSGRLDYIFYFPSYDGSTEILPRSVEVVQFFGRELSDDGLTTNQSSDHWGVYGQFKLIRR